ncbi:MAG: AmmeMemoRadiSam system protein B [SAR324 cluster bacterium]
MFHRSMALAGTWYPRTAAACLERMRAWEQPYAAATPHPDSAARCCIAPHAGWMYSGRLAARAIRAAAGTGADTVRLVVVLGGHLHRDDPVIAMCEGQWETPFGPFLIHPGFDSRLEGLPDVVRESSSRNEPDNSVEVLLPFARMFFPKAELLPIRVPPSEVALDLGARLAGYLASEGMPAAVIASTDLTHYGPSYGFEPRGRGVAAEQWVREQNDPQCIRAIESGSGRTILDSARRQRNACCPGAVAAINEIVRAHAMPPNFRMLEYATSLDAAREADPGVAAHDFVGYVAGIYD